MEAWNVIAEMFTIDTHFWRYEAGQASLDEILPVVRGLNARIEAIVPEAELKFLRLGSEDDRFRLSRYRTPIRSSAISTSEQVRFLLAVP